MNVFNPSEGLSECPMIFLVANHGNEVVRLVDGWSGRRGDGLCSVLQCGAVCCSNWWMADLGEGRVGFTV